MVVVGEVIATFSVTIKIHMLFYKHLELAKSLHIEPKGENIVFVSNAFKNMMNMLFQALLREKKKEDRKLQNVNLIKSRKYRHARKVSCATQGKEGEATKSSYLLD